MAAQIIAEFKALGAWCVIHGPEIWLALAIWGAGAMCGVAASWAAIAISERRETHEHNQSSMDRPGKRGGGPSAGRDSESGGGRR